MKKTKQKEIFAEDVASKNEIWQHRKTGKKYIVIKINTKTIALLLNTCTHIKDPISGHCNWINESPASLIANYKLINKMVTA